MEEGLAGATGAAGGAGQGGGAAGAEAGAARRRRRSRGRPAPLSGALLAGAAGGEVPGRRCRQHLWRTPPLHHTTPPNRAVSQTPPRRPFPPTPPPCTGTSCSPAARRSWQRSRRTSHPRRCLTGAGSSWRRTRRSPPATRRPRRRPPTTRLPPAALPLRPPTQRPSCSSASTPRSWQPSPAPSPAGWRSSRAPQAQVGAEGGRGLPAGPALLLGRSQVALRWHARLGRSRRGSACH
jgi:hypothetical protein